MKPRSHNNSQQAFHKIYSEDVYKQELSRMQTLYKTKHSKHFSQHTNTPSIQLTQVVSSTQYKFNPSRYHPNSTFKTLSQSQIQQQQRKNLQDTVSGIMKPYLKEQLTEFLSHLTSKGKIQKQPKDILDNEQFMSELPLIPNLQQKATILVKSQKLLQASPQNFSTLGQEGNSDINQIWQEIRVLGQTPKPRAYHSAVVYEDNLYVFGGRDNNRGSFGDLHILGQDEDGNYCWRETKTYGSGPEYLSGHTSILIESKLYIYGGRLTTMKSSNTLYQLDLQTFKWQVIDTVGDDCIGVDGHTAVIMDNRIIIFGGFAPYPKSGAINALQIWDPENNSWQVSTQSDGPAGRAYHSATVLNNYMWVYSGLNGDTKHDDFWKWDQNTWQRVYVTGRKGPGPRFGHITFTEGEHLFLFSGSQNILCERNDLWSFNGESWICIEVGFEPSQEGFGQFKNMNQEITLRRKGSIQKNSFRKIQRQEDDDDGASFQSSQLSQVKIDFKRNKAVEEYVQKVTNDPSAVNKLQEHEERDKVKERQEQFQQQWKKHLLKVIQSINFKKKDFQIDGEEQKRLQVMTPTTSQMKASIQNLEDPNTKPAINRLRNAKLNPLPLQRLLKTKNVRPLPRDGATLAQFSKGWYLFGGDRHKVTFNDVWIINQQSLIKFSD